AVKVVDAVFAEVVGADVGDQSDVGALHAQAAAQQAAARGLQDRGLCLAVAQQAAGAARAGPVALVEQGAVQVQAVGAAVGGAPAVGHGDGGEQAHGGGLAVGA